jgi:hypothetical protein
MREWGIPAVQCYFHKDGTWFNRLEEFPGALSDPHGYILFETESAYLNCPQIKVGEQTNVPGGIASIPGYIKMK